MKLLIINNVGSMATFISNKFKYDEVKILSFNTKINDTNSNKKYISLNIFNVLHNLIYNYFWCDVCIFNSPVGKMWELLFLIDGSRNNKKIIPYFHGDDIRENKNNDIYMFYDVCFYSTPDLKQYLLNFIEPIYIKCKPIKKNIGDVLIFSRNDDFKKTDKYFKYAIKNPNEKIFFLDWFKDNKYKVKFISKMPDNCELIPLINNDLIPNYLRGFKKVFGQRSGFRGISEKEIDLYRSDLNNKK